MVQILRHPMRLYIFKRHLHHGLTGSLLIAVGVVLVMTDIKDFPWRFAEDFEKYVKSI